MYKVRNLGKRRVVPAYFGLPETLVAWVEAEAAAYGITKSELYRRALYHYYERFGITPLPDSGIEVQLIGFDDEPEFV